MGHAPVTETRLSACRKPAVDDETGRECVPEGGGGGGERSVSVLSGPEAGGAGASLIPYSLDSLESVLGRDDPREALGDSVFSILEL